MKKASYVVLVIFLVVVISRLSVSTSTAEDLYLNVIIFTPSSFAAVFSIGYIEKNLFIFKNKFLNWFFN